MATHKSRSSSCSLADDVGVSTHVSTLDNWWKARVRVFKPGASRNGSWE